MKKGTHQLVKECQEKRHLLQIQRTPEQILREHRMNISKSRVALIQLMAEPNKEQEIASEALALKGYLEAVSSMVNSREFSKKEENEKQENSESGKKKTESPRMLIRDRILQHSVNDSLAKCHRVITLLLSLVTDDEKKSTVNFCDFVSLIEISLLECDDLISWCLKETNQPTLPIPIPPVSSLRRIPLPKKRKFEEDSIETVPPSSNQDMKNWCHEMQQKYPHSSFSWDVATLLSSGLHLISTSRGMEFHFNLSLDLSSTPLQISLHSICKDSQSCLPSLVTPFSYPLSYDSHHQSPQTSSLLREMERHMNLMIQAFRENESPDNHKSPFSLMERMVVYFYEEISNDS